jgi:hypothetical protein
MRTQLKITFGGILLGSIFLGWHSHPSRVVVVPESKNSEIGREIASLNESAGAPEAFTFHRSIQARLNSKAGTPPKNFANVAYEGKFFVEWKKAATPTARFSFVLAQGQHASAVIEATLTADYHLLSLRAPTASTEFDQDTISVLKDLVSIYAFRSDEDTTGKYEAKWTNLTKTKIKYLSPQFASIQILNSKHAVELAADQKTPVAFSGIEETAMKSGKEAVLISHSEYQIQKIKFAANDLKLIPAQKLNEKLKDATLQLSASANPYTHVAWSSVRPQLDSVSNLPASERLKVFHALVHALKTNPDELEDLTDFIRQNASNPVKANLAIGAMATAGTPDAQKALIELYQEWAQAGNHLDLQHAILGAFTTSDAPATPDTRTFLNSLVATTASNDTEVGISEDAAFALGSSMQKESDPAAEKKLSDYYSAAATDAQKMASLDAMGNSGDANFIPVLEQNLNSSDAALREKAVFSARYIQDPRVSSIFAQAMSDSDVRVSEAAVQAIPYQADAKSYSSLLQKCSGSSNSQLSKLCTQTLSNLN